MALDDFGVAYPSLNYLKRFPILYLKIDQGFVSNIGQSDIDLAIIQTILDLASNLGLKVIAEGVEDREQFLVLKHMSCDLIQGYLFSKPVCAQEIRQRLKLELKQKNRYKNNRYKN